MVFSISGTYIVDSGGVKWHVNVAAVAPKMDGIPIPNISE
jgi:hypothetical protein